MVEEPPATEPIPDTTEHGVEPGVGTDPDDAAGTLIGLTEAEATTQAEANGWTVRVVARDGESFAVTDDFGFSRVNLVIVDDIVTEVTVG